MANKGNPHYHTLCPLPRLRLRLLTVLTAMYSVLKQHVLVSPAPHSVYSVNTHQSNPVISISRAFLSPFPCYRHLPWCSPFPSSPCPPVQTLVYRWSFCLIHVRISTHHYELRWNALMCTRVITYSNRNSLVTTLRVRISWFMNYISLKIINISQTGMITIM